MAILSDDRVRAAAIAKVQQLARLHSNRIPRAALMQGISLDGQRIPVWNYQKGIFKPRVLGPDGAALSIQTSNDSPYEDEHDFEAGTIIYKYRGTDPLHPDNVALRRARERQLPLIYLVGVDPGVYDAIVPAYVTGEEPSLHQFTLMVDAGTLANVAEDPLARQARREYHTRTILQRLHQKKFRRMVLQAYRGQCAICRLRHVPLLDAAHILPDRHPGGVAAVSNGLGLCKIHHSAYDADIIGVDPDARIHVREDVLTERDGPMLRHGLQEIEGGRLILPHRRELRPNREFLAERFERFRAA